ncbi:MAG TPA: hypothetical protein PK828_07035 [Limnochordia bacterium]|nr:hypothetical protein [Limnochordia bacterium]
MEQQASAFWEKAWQLARRRSIFRANDRDSKAYWDKRAGNFSKNTTGKQGSRRVAQIMGWLQ